MTKVTPEEIKSVVEPHIEIKDGVAEFDRDTMVKAALDLAGMEEKDINKAYNTVSLVNNGIAMAFGEKAIEHLAKHKKVDSVSMKLKVAQEKVNLTTDRHTKGHNSLTGKDYEYHGNLTMRRTLANGGSELNGIKEHMRSVGAKKLV